MNKFNYKNYLILLLMYVLEFLTINLVNFYIFNSVIDLFLFNIIISLEFFIIFHKKNSSFRNPLFIMNIIMLICIPIVFFFSKPNFTYNEAKQYIINNEANKKLEFLDKRGFNISTINSPKFLVRRAYMLFPKENSETKVYIFDPINGNYYITNLKK